MSNLEHITSKILVDATAEKKAILAAATAAAKSIKQAAKTAAEDNLAAASTRAGERAKLTRDRVLYGAEREARDLVLAARRRALERVFTLAENRLVELEDGAYIAVLTANLEQLSGSQATVALSVPPDRFKLVAEAGFKGVEVTADPTVQAGFKLSRGGVTVNSDFIDLLHFLKEDLLHETALALEELAKVVRDEA